MRFKDNCQVFVRPLQETGVCVCVFCMFVCMYVCLFVRVCLFVCVFLCLSVCARKTRKVRIRVCARCMKWALIGTIVFISPHVKTLSASAQECFSGTTQCHVSSRSHLVAAFIHLRTTAAVGLFASLIQTTVSHGP